MRLTPGQEERLRDAAAGGWTYDGRAQPFASDLRALLDEVDALRAEAASRERTKDAAR